MSTVYRLKASELDRDFLEQIKAIFGDKEIEITVAELDETAYLLKSEGNKKRLLRAVENLKEGQNLVEVNLQDLEWAEELFLNPLLLQILTNGRN